MPSAKTGSTKSATTSNQASVGSKSFTFNQIVILSPGSELTATEAELRLRTVSRYLKLNNMPPIIRVAQIQPTANSTALALYRAFRAVGHGGPVLYLSAGDATEGALSILQTDWGNTFLAPNDGTLGLLAALFEQRKIGYMLSHLNLDLLETAEQERMQNPDWHPATDFALRDILAPAAAQLLTGTAANKLTATSATRTNATGLYLQKTAFASNLSTLPSRLGQAVPLHTISLGKGQFLLNVTQDLLSYEQLQDDKATFTLTQPGKTAFCRALGLHQTTTVHAHVAETTCCSSGCGCGHQRRRGCNSNARLELSPYPAPTWDERFLILTLPSSGSCGGKCGGSCGCNSSTLSGPITLTRTR